MLAFDRSRFVRSLAGAVSNLDNAFQLGDRFAEQEIRRLHFVGCGAPNRLLSWLQYWAGGMPLDLEIHTHYAAEFVHYPPAHLDEHTLVLLASHSGTTADTLDAARYASTKPCRIISLTQSADSPLARSTGDVIPYGETDQGYYAALMNSLAFFSGLVSKQPGWKLHGPLKESLPAVPGMLADVMESENEESARLAESMAADRVLYLIGAGAASRVAYVFAACILMEMQWLHAIPLNASEFFHGPLEVMDESTPVLVMVDESPNRPEAQRAADFLQRITPRLKIHDSKQHAMNGIHSALRPMLSPFVIDAALVRFAENLAELRNHPLTRRRYMGKMEY